MESPNEAADDARRTFSQVLFMDIPQSYPPSTSITCCFNLTASFQPNPRDWVGVFKVGWSTTKDYHTFVWVEPCLDVVGQQVTRQAFFKDYYLPKDEIEFYQFCYVDSTGQVRGASTPFCFRNPVEASLESSPEEDLLVITTQEQVDQSVREKAELQRELDQTMAENKTLKNALQQEQQDAANLKEQNEEKEKEKDRLVRELDHMKEQNENLNSVVQQQQKETEQLKEEVLTLMTKQMQLHNEAEQTKQSQSLDEVSIQKEKHTQEKYDRAVLKINQMKAEREELKEKVESQSTEVTTLNIKLREQERELLKMKDSIQLLQVDLQSSEKEKEHLSVELQKLQTHSHNVDGLTRENQELTRRLSHLETLNCSDDKLRAEYETLAGKLRDAQAKLAAEKEESKSAKRQAEFLDRELQDTKEQLTKVMRLHDKAQRTTGKQELNLSEAHELLADKESIIEEKEDMIRLERHEKEELVRENQSLNRDIEGLRRLNADLQAASSVNLPHIEPDSAPLPRSDSNTPEWQQLEIPEQEEQLCETIEGIADPEEESLVCRHCQERFPGITPEELEQHEQCHRVCPFCTMICDNMEQSVFEDHVYGHEL
ncbi:calcium-binding and coiled-coil domain-containing protein 2 isoform X2 [Notolabrus celidotus]|uniref:calcium-binding and coiled-coil domain-containing protein 2 isoform X2 n=1 Tax=Notolabrus celidotus TaxID=1203425 RepID=UPI00148FC095|nr:calcium-binding and coiled-coil domain-containing protein 2 isoform X2 [Notolabrus celidotus]